MLFEEIAKANMDALRNHDKVARSILSIVYGKFKNERFWDYKRLLFPPKGNSKSNESLWWKY